MVTTEAPKKGTKAVVGAVIATVLAIAVGVEGLIPDDTVQLVCQLVTLALTAAGTAFGVYQTTNQPK